MSSPIFNLPLIEDGESLAAIAHNEAIAILEVIAAGVLESWADVDPDSLTPSDGQAWVRGTSGNWPGGEEGDLAIWLSGWRFVPPRDGLVMQVGSDERVYIAAAWSTV